MKYEIYTGKTNASKKGATYDVVMRLMDPFLNQGYKLYLDNFYTSPTLFMDLWRKKTDACGSWDSTTSEKRSRHSYETRRL